MQLGKNDGKNSIAIAVDVATGLMKKYNLTPKFTLEELQDKVSHQKCGLRGQSRRFYQLNKDFAWTGKKVQLKVPVVQLAVFTEEDHLALAKSKRL